MSATPLVSPPRDDPVKALAAAAPFRDLPAPVLKSLAETAELRRYGAGEAIVALGQFDGGEAFFVAEGSLKAAVADRESGATVVEDIRHGAFWGLAEAVLGGDHPRTEQTSLTAETGVALVALDAAALRLVIQQRPSLCRNLMLHFARSLADMGFHAGPADASPERRIFAALLRHVERDAAAGIWRIARMPKHRELADDAGVEESEAAGAIARLIQDGVARRDYPGLVIADMTRFGRLAE